MGAWKFHPLQEREEPGAGAVGITGGLVTMFFALLCFWSFMYDLVDAVIPVRLP